MNRRDSIRSIFLGSMAGGLALESCVTEPKAAVEQKIWEYQYGRTPEEQAYDEKLLGQQFFENSELANQIVLKSIDKGLMLFWLLWEKKAVRISPPLTITEKEIKKGCAILKSVIDEVCGC